ncbi:MAG: TPM domain-containing protein [Steroidobacteraceae bacterium]
MSPLRWIRHLFMPWWLTHRRFGPAARVAIERAVGEVESRHAGEIRVAIETALDLSDLYFGVTAHGRALAVFGLLGVWDTAGNNGVLIYVLMADHKVEIIADRGIAARVPKSDWEAICRGIENAFRAGRYGDGVANGVRAVGEVLARYFPHDGGDRNEQRNTPTFL